ncbi:MAG TPA: Bax inhibitor-1/YccA family protein [Rhodothermales bacterium]|nr:Bax inhibitor-1/YccA family protein [Rhodothermales bacterium]
MEPYSYPTSVHSVAQSTSFLTRAYGWMTIGLLVTAIVAFLVVRSETLLSLVFGSRLTLITLVIAQIGLVVFLSARVHRLTTATAAGLFLLYSALTGLTLSVVLLVYTAASIASVFVITGLTFAAMTVYGLTTGRDLTAWGSLLLMGLIGVILASVVNLFLGSSTLDWVISLAGVVIFVGLTAYDAQKLKDLATEVEGTPEAGRLAILGALTLYLDFVNLFLFLLRLLGQRR